FFFSSRRRHTRFSRDWSSDVCSSDLEAIERKDRDLGGQLRRSLNSTALNVAEAFGVLAGNARLSFRRALGELYESQATFQVAAASGTITVELPRFGGQGWWLREPWREPVAHHHRVGRTGDDIHSRQGCEALEPHASVPSIGRSPARRSW